MKLYTIVSWNRAKFPHGPHWEICESWGKGVITTDEKIALQFLKQYQSLYPAEEFKILEMTEYLS